MPNLQGTSPAGFDRGDHRTRQSWSAKVGRVSDVADTVESLMRQQTIRDAALAVIVGGKSTASAWAASANAMGARRARGTAHRGRAAEHPKCTRRAHSPRRVCAAGPMECARRAHRALATLGGGGGSGSVGQRC